MKTSFLFPVLLSLVACVHVRASSPTPAPPAKPEMRTMRGQLLKADTHQPLANLKLAVGTSENARSIFGLVEHHVFGRGRTDALGRFVISFPETAEFKKASAEKTLLIVVSGNRDYLGVTLLHGEKPVYLVPKVVTVQDAPATPVPGTPAPATPAPATPAPTH